MEIKINNDETIDIIFYYNKCIDVILRLLEKDTDREKEILNISEKILGNELKENYSKEEVRDLIINITNDIKKIDEDIMSIENTDIIGMCYHL